jgi:hypothetical protein
MDRTLTHDPELTAVEVFTNQVLFAQAARQITAEQATAALLRGFFIAIEPQKPDFTAIVEDVLPAK